MKSAGWQTARRKKGAGKIRCLVKIPASAIEIVVMQNIHFPDISKKAGG